MIIMFVIYAFSILGFAFHASKLQRHERTSSKIIELALLYQIVFSLGLTSIIAFVGLTFMSDYVAAYLGWPSSPFEQELANVNLAFGVLGIMSIWYRGTFWIATVIGFSIWILSDGFHHIYEYLVVHNATAGNIGFPLYSDFIIPIVLLVLLGLYKRY